MRRACTLLKLVAESCDDLTLVTIARSCSSLRAAMEESLNARRKDRTLPDNPPSVALPALPILHPVQGLYAHLTFPPQQSAPARAPDSIDVMFDTTDDEAPPASLVKRQRVRLPNGRYLKRVVRSGNC
jgi:hypothetical protein